jgi:hypothetical protein
MDNSPSITVSVDPDGRGAWEVNVRDERSHVACPTLEDARQVAYRSASGRRPCELIVRDAYHRVIQRTVIDDQRVATGNVQRTVVPASPALISSSPPAR